MQAELVKRLARECGFELAGVARAEPLQEASYLIEWARAGLAGDMAYLTGRRAELRMDPRALLPSARSVICVGKLYNVATATPLAENEPVRGCVSRYAWGEDYHLVMRAGLNRLLEMLKQASRVPFEARVAVDSAPLLERALARRAGLGWIGRNTCLINQHYGSWIFLGELLVSLEIEPDQPVPDRCGSCARCIAACPTGALIRTSRAKPEWALDARRCISYLTIELRGPIAEELRVKLGRHIFGCDICQQVCPWNSKAPTTSEPAFVPRYRAPLLAELAGLSETEFRQRFAGSAILRAGYRGLLRNVAVALGNSQRAEHRPILERMAAECDPLVAEHARWALVRLAGSGR